MRKNLDILIPLILLLFLSAIVDVNPRHLKVTVPESKMSISDKVDFKPEIEIPKLREEYNNPDIVAYLEIPKVLKEPIVQTEDNDYYLHNDIYRNENIIGASFLDYRNNLSKDKKLLIYSHSDPEGTLPFVQLTNYNNEEFFRENRYIFLTDSSKRRKYEVFASYIETEDFDYVNLKSFGGLSYGEHLNKLKEKSYVKSEVKLDDNSKVLILQTCSFEDLGTNTKYQLVMGKEV